MDVNTIVLNILTKSGFALSGVTRLNVPLSYSLYQNWIDRGHHSEMKYLNDHLVLKKNKSMPLNATIKSALVVAVPYSPVHPMPDFNTPQLKQNKIAKYAQGIDYHFFIKEHLQKVIADLQLEFANDVFYAFTDSSPIMERDLGYKAGLGWIGKNSCLINSKQGSFFLIGEIFTSLELENNKSLSPDFCGTCDRCIKACPTQAIINSSEKGQARTINPSKCISYWTIESKEIPPIELRGSFQGWLFGCDICQDVCPWNKKHLKDFEIPNVDSLEQELCYILNSSNKELQRRFKNTAIERAAGWKLKRNAILTAVHFKLSALVPYIKIAGEKNSKLKDLSEWGLAQI
jgi:epoxyqueuosine reductase